MTKGIVYVVFGAEYEKLAIKTIAYSRQFTNLPICVLTNIKNRKPEWNKISNLQFVVFDNVPDNYNRGIKTQMFKYTPFDETLYLDCDSVLQKTGIEKVFEFLTGNDLVLNLLLHWQLKDKVLRVYKNAMLKTKTVLPLKVYNGAFIAFHRSEAVSKFFNMWHNYWLTNKGREMPFLACAVKQSNLNVFELDKTHCMFEPDIPNTDVIVQHNYNDYKGNSFHNKFGLPRIVENKPFDKNPSDWNMVEF